MTLRIKESEYIIKLINNIKMKFIKEFLILEFEYLNEEKLLTLDIFLDINKLKDNKYLECAVMRIINHQNLEIIIPTLEEWNYLIDTNKETYKEQYLDICYATFYLSKMLKCPKENYDSLIKYFHHKNPDISELFKIIKKFNLYF